MSCVAIKFKSPKSRSSPSNLGELTYHMVRNNLVLDKEVLEVAGVRLADILVVEVFIHPWLAIAKDSDRE